MGHDFDFHSLEVDEFAQTLANIAELKKEAQWQRVAEIVGRRLKSLVGTNPTTFAKLTETDVLAALVKEGPTVWVPFRTIMLIALLKEAGDFATVTYPPRGGHGWYLKALHLLLDALAHEDIREFSELVPRLEVLLTALGESRLPVRTRLLLMREYERRGCFWRVRDEFHAALERSPNNSKLLDFGIAFFERLNGESDATLASCGLPRGEIDAILSELVAAKATLTPLLEI